MEKTVKEVLSEEELKSIKDEVTADVIKQPKGIAYKYQIVR